MARYTIEQIKESVSRPKCPRFLKDWAAIVVAQHRYPRESVNVPGNMGLAIAEQLNRKKATNGKLELHGLDSGTETGKPTGSEPDGKPGGSTSGDATPDDLDTDRGLGGK